jgi:uncharacterized protein
MQDFIVFLCVGFMAQLVDGALGMGYGVVCSAVLLSLGVPPATASASVHASKIFTGAASAASHVSFGNIDKKVLWPLAAGGAAGAVAGVLILTGVKGSTIKPVVLAWLALMGVFILWRAAKGVTPRLTPFRMPAPLGVVGGVLDAVGGGGWGPTVTTTLVGSGVPTRNAVGTCNAAEFFVAVAASAAFLAASISGHWKEAHSSGGHMGAVAGLVVGGLAAAPLAGLITKSLPTRGLTWMVGLLIVALAAYQAVPLLL